MAGKINIHLLSACFSHCSPESGTYRMILSLCFIFESGIIVFNAHRIKHLFVMSRDRRPLSAQRLHVRQAVKRQHQGRRWELWPDCNHFHLLQGFLKPFKAARSFSQPHSSDADNLDMRVSRLFLVPCERMVAGIIQLSKVVNVGTDGMWESSPYITNVCLMYACCIHALKRPPFNLFCFSNNLSKKKKKTFRFAKTVFKQTNKKI